MSKYFGAEQMCLLLNVAIYQTLCLFSKTCVQILHKKCVSHKFIQCNAVEKLRQCDQLLRLLVSKNSLKKAKTSKDWINCSYQPKNQKHLFSLQTLCVSQNGLLAFFTRFSDQKPIPIRQKYTSISCAFNHIHSLLESPLNFTKKVSEKLLSATLGHHQNHCCRRNF